MKTSTIILVAVTTFMVLPAAPLALAKGGEDKPTVVQIDESGNDVDVNSMPAVKIDGSQNDVDANVTNEVEIKNSTGAALAVDTGTAMRIPLSFRSSDFSANNNITQSFTVPEGHIFVIEYITADVGCISLAACDGIFNARLEYTSSGQPARAFMPTHEMALSPGGASSFVISESVRLYADPDSTVTFFVFAVPDTGNLTGSVALSGYLLPEDAPSLAP